MKILKPYLSLFALLLMGNIVIAQNTDSYDYVRPSQRDSLKQSSNKYQSGANSIYAGFGLGGYYPYSGPLYSETPNLTVIYERAIFKQLGPGALNLGALFSFKGISSGYFDEVTGYNYSQNWNYYILGARCSYHLHLSSTSNFDLYTGIMGNYNITGFNFKSNDPYSGEPSSPGYFLERNNFPNYFSFSVFAGARSYISAKSSIWLEVGYGYTSIAFGLCYKI